MNKLEFNNSLIEKADLIKVEISQKQADNFYKYMELLLEWNKKMNLTAITEPEEVILKHFVDSLTIIPYLNDVQIDNPTKEENLSKNIDKYFEYKNEKHKNKFMDLVKGIINEAPMWKYNGYSEIEKEKGII